jgi:hypothetical protein
MTSHMEVIAASDYVGFSIPMICTVLTPLNSGISDYLFAMFMSLNVAVT